MTNLPFQEWYESDFASDPFVMSLPTWTAQNAWRCVLQKMWANGGWLPIEDHELARLLGCDVRTWRTLKELLSPGLLAEVSEISGRSLAVYRQKRICTDWSKALERKVRSRARTANATAERLRKSKKGADVTMNVTSARNDERNVHATDDRNVSTPARGPTISTTPPKNMGGDGGENHGENAPSVAHDLELTPSGASVAANLPNGDAVPRRRTNDWDLPPAPGPHDQSRFLKKFAKIQQAKPSH